MTVRIVLLLALFFSALGCSIMSPPQPPTLPAESDGEEEAEESGSVVRGVLLYVPNRVFDVLDIFRARLRLGPGFAFNARATDYLSATFGAYSTIFVGLPGPRMRPAINLPFGVEALAGVQVSAVDATAKTNVVYGRTEFGFGLQIAVVGFDLGFDPMEVVDFAGGFVTWDPRHDDL